MSVRRLRRPGGSAALGIVASFLALAAGPLGLVPVGTASAASTPDLTVVGVARYDVQPDRHRVHVTVDLEATNNSTDTVIRRYYVDHAVLAVLPGAGHASVRAPGSTIHPTVRIASRSATRTLLSVTFGKKLGSGRTLALRLAFDLTDTGGAPDRPVRVSSTIATFPVWAVGTAGAPGSSVTVTLPGDYRATVLGSALDGPSNGPSGTQLFASGPLRGVSSFSAYVLADRPGAYQPTTIVAAAGGADLSVEVDAWQDDAAFGKRTAALLRRVLPLLGERIGVPAAGVGADAPAPLTVIESVTRSAGGYAALFDGSARRIEVAYDASPAVLLHEAAHAWFNGALVADRWAAEGFASYYAGLVADGAKVELKPPSLTKTLLAARIPLNAWRGPTDVPDPAVDAYALAASYQLARQLGQRVGSDGLTAVWAAIQAGEMADQPAHGSGLAEQDPAGPSAPDWRALLDLIETRTGQDVTDLWRDWVVRPEDARLLDQRAAARSAYRALVARAGDWELPDAIRVALDRWQFDAATALMAQADEILAARPALEGAAGSIGVRLPTTLQSAFESGGGPSATAELANERTALSRIAADLAARPGAADLGPIEQVGLLGADPDAAVAAARTAFAAGDMPAAVAAADGAAATWIGARDLGRLRLGIVAAAFAAFALVVLVGSMARDRRALVRSAYRAGQVIRSVGPTSTGRGAPAGAASEAGPSRTLRHTPGIAPRSAASGTLAAHIPPDHPPGDQ